MARPRMPTNLLVLKGVDKKDPKRLREREGEPENKNPLGDPVKKLSVAERRYFETIEREAIDGVLGEADRFAVAIAAKLMKKFFDDDYTGPELSQLTKLLSQFGMTPADRSKINLPGKKKKNAFDD